MTKTHKKIDHTENLSELVYQKIKQDIFDFKLIPGQRLTENSIAQRYELSRTPVRQALYRLQQENFMEVEFRSGWKVKPLSFRYYAELYDVRIVIEKAAIEILCKQQPQSSLLMQMHDKWCVSAQEYEQDLHIMSQQDESFHCALVQATENQEMAKIHQEISEKIRIVRRLNLDRPYKIEATYLEHQIILDYILNRQLELAQKSMVSHIMQSRDEVKHFLSTQLISIVD